MSDNESGEKAAPGSPVLSNEEEDESLAAKTESHSEGGDRSEGETITPQERETPAALDGAADDEVSGDTDAKAVTHTSSEHEEEDSGPTESEPSTVALSEPDVDNTDARSDVRESLQPPSIRTEFADESASRRSSVATSRAPVTPLHAGTMVFVVTALENIASSKESRRRKPLNDSVQSALTAIKKGSYIDPEDVFEPLRLATETDSMPLTTVALDCIGKLITYSYFSTPTPHLPNVDPDKQPPPLIERAIDTICDCFQDEATTNEVQLQIVKSLLAAVLNDKFIVHGAGLLKAVRQVYNIFLLSKSPANQQVAQGTLTQMVGTVFERVKLRMQLKEARLRVAKSDGPSSSTDGTQPDLDDQTLAQDSPVNATDADDDSVSEVVSASGAPTTDSEAQKLTLQDFENAKTFDDNRIGDNAPTMITRSKTSRSSRSVSGQSIALEGAHIDEDEEDEVFIKDAYLVFRSMCRLSMKQNTPEQLHDPRGQQLRSKLIALAIIRTILNNYMDIFVSPLVTISGSTSAEGTTFGQAINQYLRLVIGRNGPSAVKQVFEMTSEIFWLVLKDMRVMMKREIEVFLKEIYLSILERRNVPNFQKLYLLRILRRLSEDPKALVEMYLNYDCDRTALDNMFQRVIELMSKLSSTPITSSAQQQVAGLELSNHEIEIDVDWRDHGRIPPSLTTMSLGSSNSQDHDVPIELLLKRGSLDCLIRTLKSLRDWSEDVTLSSGGSLLEPGEQLAADETRTSIDPSRSPRPSNVGFSEGPSTPAAEDDPSEFEQAKARKTALADAVRQFNFKPKRGIKALLKEGFILEDTPEEVARFIAENDQLDKAMIGEYLGEGEPYNIAIMHAFVDRMEFAQRRFVDALRTFLQSFRLPGEAQKIDRFMLKFAERYIAGNPTAFANADTAYVLAYSVILLNTDQHSSKMKDKRMTREDFIKNNRGINDNADLPEEYLNGIFEDIANNEIVLKTEREHAAATGLLPPSGKNAAQQADLEMSSKAEERLRSLLRAQRKLVSAGAGKYVSATSARHVGPMFNATWMSFLSGLSAQMQTTQNLETIRTCMEGIRLAIHISCMFDLDTPRDAFVAALANATNLGNLREMMVKNLEALKLLLEVALTEGNMLKGAWSSILTCISQLDRFQLISGGVDEEYVPDVRKAMPSLNQRVGSGSQRRAPAPTKRPRTTSTINTQSEIAQEARSSDMTKTVDRIFSGTEHLDGTAIVHFVRALCEVSWQEIQSSGGSDTPRMYSLQKLVEISYYNMRRVRFEWSKIWEVLGEHFNEVACQGNTNVVFFALDSLRQLSMRFMELAELPNFQFQKDFLKPFKHVMSNSTAVNVKDMVLRCLVQMIQARGDNIRSGWKTIFGVFGVAAREPYESLVNVAFDHVQQIYNTRFGVVIAQGAFPDLVVCMTEFSKNLKFQKKALNAIEALKSLVPRMLKTPECPLAHADGAKEANGVQEGNVPVSRYATKQTQQDQFWFPVLFAFHDILMTGEDLEVRSQALNYLFDTLIKFGKDFPPEFWDVLWRQLLYPIFMVLKSKSEMSKAPNHEDLSVWLSTTMIQALRNMMTLFTHYFESLEYMLDRFLDLLALCICQENDTIARIGSNCMQTLILQNVTKFNQGNWNKIVNAFVSLFERTTAHQLFTAASNPTITPSVAEDEDGVAEDTIPDANLQLEAQDSAALEAAGAQTNGDDELISPRQVLPPKNPAGKSAEGVATATAQQPLEDYRQSSMPQQPVVVTAARRRLFNRIITRCVLQLLMIETVNELFMNSEVYSQIPSLELLRLMGLLKKSYAFAKKFNNDKDLRMRLWHEGFMKQPPNLLKQESGSAATYVNILVRMYFDEGDERRKNRAETEAALVPLCADIIRSYVDLDEETQQRNILAWRPVVVDTIEAYTNFPSADFEKHIETFYPLVIDLLGRDMDRETRLALQALLRRFGEVRMGMPPSHTPLATPTSPRSGAGAPFLFNRRPSRIGSRS